MGEGDLERRCADLEELLARERIARKVAQDEARSNATALRILAREVRAPLTSALEWSGMLRRELLSSSGRDHALRVVERQITGSVHLIDDLVAITANTLPRPAKIQLDQAVLAAHVALADRLQARKLSCKLELATTTIQADPVRTERLLRRLFETAADFALEETELRVTLDEDSLSCALDAPLDLPDAPPSTWEALATPDGLVQPFTIALFLLGRLAEAQGAELRLERDVHVRLRLSLPSLEASPHKPTTEHALRSPLQVLAIGVELLRTRVRDAADDVPREWMLGRLDSLEQAVDHLTAAVERLNAVELPAPERSPSEAPQP